MHRRLVFEEPISRAAVWSRRLAWFALAVLLVALLVVRLSETTRQDLAPIAAAYVVVLLALLLATVALVRIWHSGHRGVGMAAQALALCLVMLVPAGYVGFKVATLPMLADIATDLDDPPSFSRSRVALDARHGVVPPEIPAAERRRQRPAYAKTVPVIVEIPADQAFEIARKAALLRGWQVIEAVRPGGRTGAGRIEAIARSRVLKLTDDITIRIRPRVDGARIDLRSVSRLGGHDLGQGAAQISRFAEEVELLMDAR